MICDWIITAVEMDIVNTSQLATNTQLTFPSHRRQQQGDNDDDDDGAWKQSLGFIRLSGNNLVNKSAPTGNIINSR